MTIASSVRVEVEYMTRLTKEQKQEITQILKERGANLPCPRCGNTHFFLLDGYFSQSIQTRGVGLVIGGSSVPSIARVCNRCGFISQHALGTLGLLKEKGENSDA